MMTARSTATTTSSPKRRANATKLASDEGRLAKTRDYEWEDEQAEQQDKGEGEKDEHSDEEDSKASPRRHPHRDSYELMSARWQRKAGKKTSPRRMGDKKDKKGKGRGN